MAAMADITVLNAAAGNVVYVAAAPSSGDGGAATWRANALSSSLAFRPELRIITRDNGKRTGRAFRALYKFPVTATDSTTSLPFLVGTIPFEVNGMLPMNVDTAILNDAFVQFGNLLVSTLVRTVAQTGYAPT